MSFSQLPSLDFLPDIDDAMLTEYLGRSFSGTHVFPTVPADPDTRRAALLGEQPTMLDPPAQPFMQQQQRTLAAQVSPAAPESADGVKAEPSRTHTSTSPSAASTNPQAKGGRAERKAKSQAREDIRDIALKVGPDPSGTNSTGAGLSDGSRSASEAEQSRPTARGRARRTGKGPKDAKKIAALQEKNRRAQRRFRERQKQRVTELEDKVAELELRIQNLQVEKANLASRNSMLEKVAAMRDERVQRMQSLVKYSSSKSAGVENSTDELVSAFEDQLVLTLKPVPITLTADDMRKMTPEMLSSYWREYIHQLASVLVAAGQNPAGPEAVRVEQLTTELCKLVMRVALLSPTLIKNFLLTPAENATVVPSTSGPHSIWPVVLREMNLASEQRTDMVRLRMLFLGKLYKIILQRVEINKKLETALPPGTGSREAAYQYLKASDGVQQLRSNLREEHILVLDFVTTLFKHILSPYQTARGIVQCYPVIPDCLALCTWVAAEAGEQDAIQAINTGVNPQAPQGAPLVSTMTGTSPPLGPGGPSGAFAGGPTSSHTLSVGAYRAVAASGPMQQPPGVSPSTSAGQPFVAVPNPGFTGAGALSSVGLTPAPGLSPATSNHAFSPHPTMPAMPGDHAHAIGPSNPSHLQQQPQALPSATADRGVPGSQPLLLPPTSLAAAPFHAPGQPDNLMHPDAPGNAYVPATIYSQQLLQQLPGMDTSMLTSPSLDRIPSLAQRFSHGHGIQQGTLGPQGGLDLAAASALATASLPPLPSVSATAGGSIELFDGMFSSFDGLDGLVAGFTPPANAGIPKRNS